MLEQLTSEPVLRCAMIGFAVLCAVMAFLRGIGRLVLFGLAVAAGLAVGMAWVRYMPLAGNSWFGKNAPWFVQWGAIVAGVVVAWLTRRFLHMLVKGEGPGEMDRRTRMRGGLLGFIPAIILLWGGAVAMRWAGAASRLRHVEEAVDAQDVKPLEEADLFARLGRSLEHGLVGDLMNRMDPLSSREAAAAGMLLVLQRDDTVWQRTARHPEAGPVILQPSFRRLRDDKDVEHALSFSHYSRLLALPEMDAALDDRVLREAVLNLDMEKVIPEVITGRAAGGVPRAVPVAEP